MEIRARPVYEWDQVLTKQDLDMWAKQFKEISALVDSRGFHKEARLARELFLIMGDMKEWIDAGKPNLRNWHPERLPIDE